MGQLSINEFLYNLPRERIAQFPLENRADSKLLIYQNGEINHRHFNNLPGHLPKESLLFFNDTKVIPARLFFRKKTGASIEIFLLNPIAPYTDINLAMQGTTGCSWQTMIGNLKKWKSEQQLHMTIDIDGVITRFTATLENREDKIVKFQWNNEALKFVDLIDHLGKVPLPPYINREEQAQDSLRYQTVYSHHAGAVAAPTAGLHFNDKLLQTLHQDGHQLDYLTLHVGAGTFQPVKSKNIIDHPMHEEQLVVTKTNLIKILKNTNKVIAVGTTSMRTLESIYWLGVKLLRNERFDFHIHKLDPYADTKQALPTADSAIQAIVDHMDENSLGQIVGSTEIMIFPGYNFKICDGLITNFHMPGSTLMMLVAAFIGASWKAVYEAALANNYRFLSYGDSSFLLPD